MNIRIAKKAARGRAICATWTGDKETAVYHRAFGAECARHAQEQEAAEETYFKKNNSSDNATSVRTEMAMHRTLTSWIKATSQTGDADGGGNSEAFGENIMREMNAMRPTSSGSQR